MVIITDNIFSPLGMVTATNMMKILNGESGVKRIEAEAMRVREPFAASVFKSGYISEIADRCDIPEGRYTRFETMAIISVTVAASWMYRQTLAEKTTVFILSTTKGNVSLLDTDDYGGFEKERLLLWRSAQLIAEHFGNPNRPIVVSNACISGAAAQLVAKRFIDSGRYTHAVVIGADEVSRFVVSGFQSFKAVSPDVCRPFDSERCGLNLGEAAGTIIYAADDCVNDKCGMVELTGGAITNDANHISGPSRTGEGLYRAILQTPGYADAEFIGAHGTATVYNDEMEALALTRAGLNTTPVISLKPYFGHTLGAAGVIESIVCARSLRDNCLPASLNYEECGTSVTLNVNTRSIKALLPHKTCLKTISGFGGCNAALRFELNTDYTGWQ